MAAKSSTMAETHTLFGRILASLNSRGTATSVRWKRFGIWQTASGSEMAARIDGLAASLRAHGLAHGQVAAVLGRNCYDWVCADLAIMAAGGVSAGLNAHGGGEEIVRQLKTSGARHLFICDELPPALLRAIRKNCPDLVSIIQMYEGWDSGEAETEAGSLAGAEIILLDAFLAKRFPDAAPSSAVAAHDEAAIIFSSGSTGPSRGAVFSHASLLTQAVRAEAMLVLQDDDECLSLLPIHHVLERLAGIYAPLLAGTVINFPENSETVFANLNELQPTVILATPRTWSRLRGAIMLNIASTTRFQKAAVRRAFGVGGLPIDASGWANLPKSLMDHLVLAPIRERLGLTRARLCLTGGAVAQPDLVQWFTQLGRPLLDLYGHAETGVVSLGQARSSEAGGYELRIGDRGEICLRGAASFSRYVDGSIVTDPSQWWRSGDIGKREDDGHVRVLGSLAHLLDESDEASSSPFDSEKALKASPYIADAFLLPRDKGEAHARILIEFEAVVDYAQNNGIPFTHFESLCRASEVRDLIGKIVADVNRTVPAVKISGFQLIERLPKPGDADLTPVQTLRRYLFAVSDMGKETMRTDKVETVKSG